MNCCENDSNVRRTRITALVLAMAALGAAAFAAWHDLRRREAPPVAASPRVRLEARPAERPLVGDPDHGRHLYALNCASCHGAAGNGAGPAADVLWPPPRNHQDAAYMLSRTDEQLFTAIRHGGRGVQRSYLMPAWSDVFDRFQTWNLVAYMRTLTPELPQDITRTAYQEAYLSDERLRRVERAGLPRLVGVLRLYDERTGADGEAEEYLKYFMLFPRVRRAPTVLAVQYDPEGRFLGARTHHRIVVDGAPTESGPELDVQLAGAQGAMSVVLEQLREDQRKAESAFADYGDRPDRLSRGSRLYMTNCGACHGFTGRVLGPMVTERDAWPRVLADAGVMSRLSDEYLGSLIRKGGLHWNLSSVMPANPGLTDDEISDIVGHVRSLSDPRADGPCPCAALGIRCEAGMDERGCCCQGTRDPKRLCSNMRR